MPRRKEIPPYCLHKPSGQARVIIGGRHVYLGPYDSPESKAKYQEVVRKHLAERTKAELERSVAFATDVTVAEILVQYIAHVECYYRKHGEATNQVTIIKLSLRVLRQKFGDLEAKEFGPKALKACREEFVRLGLCRNEVNRRTALIRQCFKWAVSEELVPPTVWHGLQSVSGLLRGRTEAPDHKPVTAIPEAVVEEILPHLRPAPAAMVRLQMLTGMRPDEVVRMRGRDLNTTGAVWEFVPESHKTQHRGKSRVIMLGPQAQAIVKEWLRTDLEAFLFIPRESVEQQNVERRQARQTPLWASHRAAQTRKRKKTPKRAPGARYSVASYRRAIHRACDLAGVPRFSPNRLRHSAATRLRREMGLDAARVVLGHSDADTTTIYAERDMNAARAAMELLG
jgi:integrase